MMKSGTVFARLSKSSHITLRPYDGKLGSLYVQGVKVILYFSKSIFRYALKIHVIMFDFNMHLQYDGTNIIPVDGQLHGFLSFN